jgi:predicted ATPase
MGLYELTDSFTPFRVFRFSPSEIARPVVLGTEVSHSGTGLAAELDRLLGEQRAEFDKLVSSLKAIFPHISQVKVATMSGRRDVLKGTVFETQGGIQVPAELESDGVLLTLAFLWLSTRKDPAFGIEEPETATYPSLLESRMRMLRSLSEGIGEYPSVQVIATTHSSLLLTAAKETSLVRVFELREDGSSRIYAPKEEFMQELIYKRLAWSTGTEK